MEWIDVAEDRDKWQAVLNTMLHNLQAVSCLTEVLVGRFVCYFISVCTHELKCQ
jgi:hypothetical protein